MSLQLGHSTQPNGKVWNIAAFGDSTTVGATKVAGAWFLDYANAEPQVIHDILFRDYGIKTDIPNYGVGGSQASQLLFGEDGVHKPWIETMRVSDADIILLNFGLNDLLYYRHPMPNLMRESPDQFRQILAALVAVAQSFGKQVVLQEPNPSSFHDDNEDHPNLLDYVRSVRDASTQTGSPIVGQYDMLLGMPNWRQLLLDGTHPTREMYFLKAKNSASVLARIIAQHRSSRG